MEDKNKEFQYRVKIDNKVIDDMLKNKEKRALFIYMYIQRDLKAKSISIINLAEIATFLSLKTISKNIKSIKSSFSYLIKNDLIEVYTDRFRDNKIDDLEGIKANTLICITAPESLSEEFFTLVEVEAIDKILYQRSDEDIEDMIALLALINRQIERREEVRQVAWFSVTHIVSALKIKSNRYKPLIDEMKRLEIIYFNKAEIKTDKFKKEHYIYSMYDMADHVEQAISIAEENGKLDARVKLVDEREDGKVETYIAVEPDIDEETGEILWVPTNYALSEVLFSSDFEMNQQSAKILNQFAEEFSPTALSSTIKMLRGKKIGEANVYVNLVGKDNTTGFILNGLKEKLEAKRRKEKLVA